MLPVLVSRGPGDGSSCIDPGAKTMQDTCWITQQTKRNRLSQSFNSYTPAVGGVVHATMSGSATGVRIHPVE